MSGEQSSRYNDICRWFVQKISAVKQLSPSEIEASVPFSYYGLDSKELVSLSGEFESFVSHAVDPTLFWDYPSIHSVAQYYSSRGEDKRGYIRSGGSMQEHADGVAVIGMGCRFPKAKNISEYWRNLHSGLDCISEIPVERSAHFAQDGMRYAGLVDDIDRFDNEAFYISPREAEQMDPQQRMLLEVAWEAIEDAGLTNERLSGSRTGVFAGISSNDYGYSKLSDFGQSSIYRVTGNSKCIAANRISYIWNLRGPSLAVDTACSSSLVAIHLACQSLRTGESDMAIASGVNVILNPGISKAFLEAGMLSADGRCKTFDSQADGYVRGEGAGAVILKPLSDALRDQDKIYAVIRGSAINQDGLSNGLTAPNLQAQEEVLKEAYRIAGVQAEHIDYIEAHGTGTALGDPIEVQAIGRVLSTNRSMLDKCYIGSVKTNFGHLEAAAGIAGFIKTVLCLKNREWVPNLHFQQINPYIPFQDLPLQVVRQSTTRPAGGRPALAGVSSFGFGGTNAHVVLQQYVPVGAVPQKREDPKLYFLPLSANTESALARLAADTKQYLHEHPDMPLTDICYTAQRRRTHRAWRGAAIGSNRTELIGELERLDARCGTIDVSKMVFVFSGQGNQWPGMGRYFLEHEGEFKRVFLECDALWDNYAGWSLWDELHRDQDDAWSERTDAAQPLVFAVQVSLAALWKSWGVEPKAVIGHSLGEIAAHYTAGVLSLEDALLIVYWRSKLMQTTQGQGAMALVRIPLADIEQRLADNSYSSLCIAAVNGPTSIALSGDKYEVERFIRDLPDTVKTYPLSSSFAFHSRQMEPLCDRFHSEVKSIRHRLAHVRIYSTVTGQVENGLRIHADHWLDNMRKPVLFADALVKAKQDGYEAFVEVGPHPVLIQNVEECFEDCRTKLALFSMRKGDGGESMLQAAVKLYQHGVELKWGNMGPEGECVSIPTYPWEKKRFWIDDSDAPLQGTIAAPPVTEDSLAGHHAALSVQSIIQVAHERERALPLLEQHLQTLFASILKITPAADLSMDQPLVMLGMDSIMALQLKHKIEQEFQVSLPLVHFLEGTTTRQAALKMSGILQDTRCQDAVEHSQIDDLLASDDMERDVSELSDEDMDRLLLLLTQKGSE